MTATWAGDPCRHETRAFYGNAETWVKTSTNGSRMWSSAEKGQTALEIDRLLFKSNKWWGNSPFNETEKGEISRNF